jgi:hypothetical protein
MAIYPTPEQIQNLLAAPDDRPSRKTFVEIAMSDRVREIGADRAAGLESQWLIATTTRTV